jgi:hypothetical protein
VETIEYPKRTPGIRYSDEEEVLLSTPTGAAGPVGSGPYHTTWHTRASFDVNAVCWSNLGRACVDMSKAQATRRRAEAGQDASRAARNAFVPIL